MGGKDNSHSERDDISRSAASSRMTTDRDLEARMQGTTSKLMTVLGSCEGVWPWRIVLCSLFVDTLQYLGLVVNPHLYSPGAGVLPDLLYWSHLPFFDSKYVSITQAGYSAFLWLIAVVLIVMAVLVTLLSGAATEKKTSLAAAVRVAAASLSTWLYIPFLQCVFALITCGENSKLWMFPSVECWSGQHLPYVIAGVIILLVYVPAVYLVRVCVCESSPSSPYFYAKAHTTMDAASFLFRTVTVILFHVLLGQGDGSHIAYTAIVGTLAFMLSLSYAFVMPYFYRGANAMAVCQLFLVSLAAGIHVVCEGVEFMHFEKVKGLLLVALLPIGALLSCTLALSRINKEVVRALTDIRHGVSGIYRGWGEFAGMPHCDRIAATLLSTGLGITARDGKKGGAYGDQTSCSAKDTQDLIILPYVTKVWIDTDVEVVGRALQELRRLDGGAEPSQRQIGYTFRVFAKGLMLFRYSATVKLQYVWFLFAVAERPHVAYNFFESNEDAALVFAHCASIQARYNAYKVKELLKKRLNIKERHFELCGRKATLLHEEVLGQMYEFWQRLMELSVDMVEVGALASSIAENRTKGLELFKKALTGDTRMLVNFADYLDGVMLNKEAAKMCLEEVQELDVEKKSRQMGGSRKAADTGPVDSNSVVQRVLDSVASQKDMFGVTASSTVRRLTLNMNIVFLLLTLLVVGNLVSEIMQVDVQLNIVKKMDAAGQARMLALKATYEIFDLFHILEAEIAKSQTSGLTTFSTEALEQQRATMAQTAKRFSDAHNALTYGGQSSSYGPHVRYYEEPLTNIVFFHKGHERTHTSASLWEIGNIIMNSLHTIQMNLTTAVLMSSVTSSTGTASNLAQVTQKMMHDESVQFMLHNSPTRIALAYNRSLEYYENEAEHRLDIALSTLIGIFAISCVVTLAIYLLFLWNFKKITVSKLIILQLFTLIPYDTLAWLSADAKDLLNNVRGLSRGRARKHDTGLPSNLVIEIEKGLHGEEVDEPTPLRTLEKYLKDRKVLKDTAMVLKLKQYINIVKNKPKSVNLDPDALMFFQVHIQGAAAPVPCLKIKGQSQEDDGPQGCAVGFKGKIIIGKAVEDDVASQGAESDEVEGENADLHAKPDVQNLSTTARKESRMQPDVPVLFWVLNLGIVLLAAASFSLVVVASRDIGDLKPAYKDDVAITDRAQNLLIHSRETIHNARAFVQYGDLRFYLAVMDRFNSEALEHDVDSLIDAGATMVEMEYGGQIAHMFDALATCVRKALKASITAFNKDPALMQEVRDTVLSNDDTSSRHTPAEYGALARELIYEHAFIAQYNDFQDVCENLIQSADSRTSNKKESVRAMLIAAAALMFAVAALACASGHRLQTHAPLSAFAVVLYGYIAVAVGLVVIAILLLILIGEIDTVASDAQDAVAHRKRQLHDFSPRRTLAASALAQEVTQFQHLDAAYAYYAYDIGGEGDKLITRMRDELFDSVSDSDKLTLNSMHAELMRLERIAITLVIKPATHIGKLENYVKDTKWNITEEATFFEVLRKSPFCNERERGCRSRLYTTDDHDLLLSLAERDQLARETLFTPPYTDILARYDQLVQTTLDNSINAIDKKATDDIESIESRTRVFCIVSAVMNGLAIVGSSCLATFILIHFAGNQGKQKSKNQLDSPLLSKLLFRCRISLLLVIALVAAIFAVGTHSVLSTRDQAGDLNLVSAREWVVARAMVYADVLDGSNSEQQGVARHVLAEMLHVYVYYRNKLYFGETGTSEYNEVHSTKEQGQLLFGGDDTTGADKVLATYVTDECGNDFAQPMPVPVYSHTANTIDPPMPLDLAITAWQGQMRHFLDLKCPANGACTERDTVLHRLRATVGALLDTLEASGDLYEDRAKNQVLLYALISKCVFGFTLATIICLYFLVFRKMLSQLTHEENGTKGVLKMIPQQVIESVSAISEYLETGKVDNTEQLAKNFEQSERLLANILPENISARLKSGESPIADTHASITILFTDFVGFTSISSSLGAVEIVSFLNEVFIEFDLIAELLSLEKIKTIGDAYFMAGGLKPSLTDHAVRVVEASMQMYEALEEHNQRHPDRKELQMRLGCHTGPAVAGCIGVKKVAYDLWGESVQMAEKMESGGVPGRIHISPTTEEQVREMYITEARVCPKVTFTTYLVSGRRQPTAYMHLRRASCKPLAISNNDEPTADQHGK